MPAKRKSSSTRRKTPRLTPTEKKKIAATASKAQRFIGGTLTAERRDEIFAQVQVFKKSKKPVIGKEAIALWAAKVDYAIVNGDKLKLKKLLKSPKTGLEAVRQEAFYDSNGGCSCSGGGTTTANW